MAPRLPYLSVERLQGRRLALAPQPDLRGRPLALCDAGLVDRMVGEDGPAPLHQVAQQIAARPLRQMVGDRLVRDVVRRLRLRVGGEGGRLVGSENEDIAVADAAVEFEPAAGDGSAERGVDGLDERPAFLAGDVAGREVAHLAVLDVDEVAADRPVVGAERNAHRRGFERRPAGVDGERVVAEEAERGHVAGRRQRRGHVVGAADHAGAGDAVHVRLAGRLQRRLAAEGFLRLRRRSRRG